MVSHEVIFRSHLLYYSMKTEKAELARSFNQDKNKINAILEKKLL